MSTASADTIAMLFTIGLLFLVVMSVMIGFTRPMVPSEHTDHDYMECGSDYGDWIYCNTCEETVA